jgi:MerR family transcriptional regulator/heat shock protein HspR
LLRQACDEGLIEVTRGGDQDDLLSSEHAERLRLIAVLMRDLDVNLAGVEVILHMREDLRSMHRQFDEILRDLVAELRRRVTQ